MPSHGHQVCLWLCCKFVFNRKKPELLHVFLEMGNLLQDMCCSKAMEERKGSDFSPTTQAGRARNWFVECIL